MTEEQYIQDKHDLGDGWELHSAGYPSPDSYLAGLIHRHCKKSKDGTLHATIAVRNGKVGASILGGQPGVVDTSHPSLAAAMQYVDEVIALHDAATFPAVRGNNGKSRLHEAMTEAMTEMMGPLA